MNRLHAARIARQLMDEHGFANVPFEFDRRKTALGRTETNRYSGQVTRITLSELFVEVLPEDEIRVVILHEIAHAKAGHAAGHGPVWKREARALGIKGDRCARPSALPESNYTGRCPKCGFSEYRCERLPRRVKACSKCGGPFNSRIIVWLKNNRPLSISDMPSRYQMEMLRLR